MEYHCLLSVLIVALCLQPILSSKAHSDELLAGKQSKYVNSDDIIKAYSRNEAGLYAMLSAGLVGLSGIAPLAVLPFIRDSDLSEKNNAKNLKRLLSFAVGSLLGDVFLHLLPESWDHLNQMQDKSHDHWPATLNGLWILIGLISFCLLEKLIPSQNINEEHEYYDDNQNLHLKMNGYNSNENNNNIDVSKKLVNGVDHSIHDNVCNKPRNASGSQPPIKNSGYLNLFANFIDNFTHGLAVGGSYLVSWRVGMLTTVAILLHEIPHEVGDFAILLRAGFNHIQAVKLQLLTASGGFLGTFVAFLGESASPTGHQISWILPFTSGGFIYVALCTVVPDILKETSPRESLIQIICLLAAVAVMHAVSLLG